MKRALTSRRMKQIDIATTEAYHIPSLVLMERAALAAVSEILNGDFDLSRIAVLCGVGNNGGDGVAVARILKEQNVSSDIFVCEEEHELSQECREELRIAKTYGIPIQFTSAAKLKELLLIRFDTLLIDALLGIGYHGALSEEYLQLIRTINSLPAKVVSVDLPSGVDATSGAVIQDAVRADLTVTFGHYKIGQFLYPGCQYTGILKLHPVGILQETEHTDEDVWILDQIPEIERPADANKSTFGKLLLITGSQQIGGAAVLAASSALRSGCGMVTVMTAPKNRDLILTLLPEAMVDSNDAASAALTQRLAWADVIGIGSGCGLDRNTEQLLSAVIRAGKQPLVIDADAITILSRKPALLQELTAQTDRTVVMTPHVGEFARISGLSVKEIKQDPIHACRSFAAAHHVICILKDARTVISDGNRTYLNLSGNSGMATAGSGDVLFGLVTAMLHRIFDPLLASALSVYLHGCCGDLAAKEKGAAEMIASDIILYYNNFLK